MPTALGSIWGSAALLCRGFDRQIDASETDVGNEQRSRRPRLGVLATPIVFYANKKKGGPRAAHLRAVAGAKP
jgi:hypothetical protein